MELNWESAPGAGGGLIAYGTAWAYLIISDSRYVVLTRYYRTYCQPGLYSRDVAAAGVACQSALYAIKLGGAWEVLPETAEATAAHLRQAAQEYESGEDVTGQPAWRH
jgi:hypothetical protein